MLKGKYRVHHCQYALIYTEDFEIVLCKIFYPKKLNTNGHEGNINPQGFLNDITSIGYKVLFFLIKLGSDFFDKLFKSIYDFKFE